MGNRSRRQRWLPLLSVKKRNLRLQWAQAHQNWAAEDWKNVAWSKESGFLLRHTDVRVRIYCQQHESMDPACLVSTIQAGGDGVMVWGMFSYHILSPLISINLKVTAWLRTVADHAYPFMDTVYHLLMATSSIVTHHVRRKQSSQADSWTRQRPQWTSVASPATVSESSRTPLGD